MVVDVYRNVHVVCTRMEEGALHVVNARLGTVGTSIEIVTSGTTQVVDGLGGDIGMIGGEPGGVDGDAGEDVGGGVTVV